jgi:hypothetical protein
MAQGTASQNVQQNNPLESISFSGVYVDPGDPVNREGTKRIKKVLPSALKVNHIYYWGILPYGPENIQGNWSNDQQVRSLQTSTPQTKLISPANAATVPPWAINLQWEETPGAALRS